MKKTYRFAPDYELEYKERTLDLDFWIKLVKELKVKSVLELGVGTGRVFFPLVDKLYSQLEQAVGIDADSLILSQAKKKLSSEFSRLKDKVELKKADMRDFRLKEKFDFIFIPYNTFSMIDELDDRLKVLKAVREHLAVSGYLGFEVYAPNLLFLWKRSLKDIVTKKEFWDKKEGIRLVRIRTKRYHPARQVIDNRFNYQRYRLKDNKLIDEYSTDFKLYKFFPIEMRLLLRIAGFSIVHFWGNYQRSDFNDDSTKMIVVAKKAIRA